MEPRSLFRSGARSAFFRRKKTATNANQEQITRAKTSVGTKAKLMIIFGSKQSKRKQQRRKNLYWLNQTMHNSTKLMAKAPKPRIVTVSSENVFGTSSETTNSVTAEAKTASLSPSIAIFHDYASESRHRIQSLFQLVFDKSCCAPRESGND